MAEIDLAKILDEYRPVSLTLPVMHSSSNGIEVRVTITPKVVGEQVSHFTRAFRSFYSQELLCSY